MSGIDVKTKYIILYLLAVIGFTWLGYSRIANAFFVSDEWKYIGGVYIDGYTSLLGNLSLFQILAGVGRPLGTIIQNVMYLRFPDNPLPFLIFGFISHVINCILIYFITLKLTKNTATSYIAGLFFASVSVYSQALSWIACLVEVPGSTLFALTAFNLLLLFNEDRNNRWLIGSLICAYVSFLILDANVFLFLYIPFFLAFYNHGRTKFVKILITASIAVLVLSSMMRINLLQRGTSNTVKLNNNTAYYEKSIFNSVFYPFIGISQTIIPGRLITKVSSWYTHFAYEGILRNIKDPSLLNIYIVPDIILICSSFIIIYLANTFLHMKRMNDNVLLILLAFYICKFIPIAFFLTGRNTSFIESRYMYVPAVVIAIIFGMAFYNLIYYISKRFRKYRVLAVCIFTIILLVYFYKQISVVKSEVNAAVYEQQNIKNLTIQLKPYAPIIPEKPIFYMTSDIDFYFQFNNKVPFQLGTGYMLSVLYYPTHKIPEDVIRNQDFILFGAQGYMEKNGKAFGYFWDKTKLAQLFKDNPDLNINQIIAFTYQSSTKKIIPITEEIRTYITESVKM